MHRTVVPYPELLDPPIKRSAYSDRTAWLMAVMSELAYVPFEQASDEEVNAAVSDVFKLVYGEAESSEENRANGVIDREQLKQHLERLQHAAQGNANAMALRNSLKDLQFTLLETFSVHIPLVADTQAFIARLEVSGREPILVLAFRGTEANKIADIRADLDAKPVSLGVLGGPGNTVFKPVTEELSKEEAGWPEVKVHPGFWKAFKAVEKDVRRALMDEEVANLPLYITGHSLGGALAVVATYALDNDRVAACYTFGGPRVGNLQFGQLIRPPVYRIINASDVVPRLPPGVLIDALTVFLRWAVFLPYVSHLAHYLERFRGYRHYGDMRHLSACEPQIHQDHEVPIFPQLVVHANPSQLVRWVWLTRRWIATFGKAALSDHSISLYVDKLAYWAFVRGRNSQ